MGGGAGRWGILFKSILTSSLWAEDHHVVRVWVAMLALADADGRVRASRKRMPALCHVTEKEFEHAMSVFLSPDLDSSTPLNEGRRLRPVDGGWEIVTYAHYRDMALNGSTERMRKLRANQKKAHEVTEVTEVTELRHMPSPVTDGDGRDAQMKMEMKKRIEKKKSPPTPHEAVTSVTGDASDEDPELPPSAAEAEPDGTSGVRIGSSTPEPNPLLTRGRFGTEVSIWARGVARGIGQAFLAPRGDKAEAQIAEVADAFGPKDVGPERDAWLEAEGEKFGSLADPTKYKRTPWGWGDWLNASCPGRVDYTKKPWERKAQADAPPVDQKAMDEAAARFLEDRAKIGMGGRR